MSSSETSNKSVRSHSIHVVIARDRQRVKMAERLYTKLQQDFIKLDRKMNIHFQSSERALDQLSQRKSILDQTPLSMEEFLVQERIRQDRINNAKQVANKNIRRH